MPTSNARKHVVPLGSEASFNRATIFTAFGNSIRDVVPVANTTERTSLVNALTSAGQGPATTRPLVVYRHDAPGLDRIEYTIDGSAWIPASGTLRFATKDALDSWAASNGAYLAPGHRALVPSGGGSGFSGYVWTGSAFDPEDTGWVDVNAFDANWSTAARGGYASLSVRRMGKQVILRGVLRWTSTAATSPGFQGAVVPVGFRPPVRWPLSVFAGSLIEVSLAANGEVALGVGNHTAGPRDFVLTGTWMTD